MNVQMGYALVHQKSMMIPRAFGRTKAETFWWLSIGMFPEKSYRAVPAMLRADGSIKIVG
jgi:hypothetical protein